MFHAKVKGRVFQILGIDYITSGSVGLQIDFEFDDEWTGLERYATFEAGSVSISVELENDACVIPWEVLEDPNVNLRIGIRGSNGDDVVIPTIWREYEIHEGTKFSEDSGSPASTTIIEQLSARMDVLEENGGVDIFWATYGLSSYDEIYEQFNTHNRLVVCVYNNRVYFMQKEINNSTAYKFFAPDFTSTQSRMYWLIVDNDDQWTNGYEEITSGGGDTPEITWVTYGTTTYSDVKAAYDADKQVLCEYGTITYQLTFWMGLNGPFFTFTAPVYDSRVTTQSIYWLKVDSSGWSNGSIDIPEAGTATPLMDGTAAAGSSSKYAKEDHVHPSDTTKITMPSGGTAGQVLKKTANGTEWANESGGSSPSPYTSNPAALGNSASPGSSDKYARGDHVHPKPTPSDIGAYSMPSGGIPATDLATDVANKIVYVEYGVTTASEINSLVAFGKLPVVIYYGMYYMYCGYSTISGTSYYSFYSVSGFSSDATLTVYVIHVTGSNVWSNNTLTVAKIPSGGTADQVLKKASSTNYDMVWGSVSGGTTEIFDAVYGTTTVSEIETAISNGKLLRCTYDNQQYYLGFTATSLIRSYIFFKSNGSEVNVCSIDADTGTWSHGYHTIPSAATATPSDLGTAAVGSSSKYAKEDHVHKLPTLSDLGAEPAWSSEANIQDGAVTKSLSERVSCLFTGSLTSLTITLGGNANGHYHFDFSTGSTAPTLTLPNAVLTPDGFTVEANKAYEVDILNKHAAIQSWTAS